MGGTTEFVHKDHLGSTRTVTDVAGSVIDSMDYAPFGELLLGGISPTVENWGFETGSSVDWTAFSGVSSSVTPSQSNSGIYSLAQSGCDQWRKLSGYWWADKRPLVPSRGLDKVRFEYVPLNAIRRTAMRVLTNSPMLSAILGSLVFTA